MMIMVLCRDVGLRTYPPQVLISSSFPSFSIVTSLLCIFSQVLHFFSLLFFSFLIESLMATLLVPT